MGKMLAVAGLLFIVAGFLIWALSGIPPFGRLPGDIYVRRGNFSIYLPITTSLLASVALSLLLMLFKR